jgi:hypothetical protein
LLGDASFERHDLLMLGIAGNPPPLSLRMWAGPLDLIQHLFDP